MALNVKYGISGINWVNEDMLDLGDHYTADDVLSQMQALGFEGTEFCRKFPRSVPELSRLLERYGMTLVAQWKSLAFRDASRREEEMRAFREHADFCGRWAAVMSSPARRATRSKIRIPTGLRYSRLPMNNGGILPKD
ncbi:hypothetical protein PACILC2_51280 [Paenibacillus cisolokensis]|uniref:Xylose isomerase-like TIM barrel domain-containing protein n=1 Tax=Paenibacillus cisolokensis TaxID=1658519 RepID=A0ABQ4NED1_9BACL|nr:hypothetical protein PACILC2_51280 [Paenibacillus cisolokensis]